MAIPSRLGPAGALKSKSKKKGHAGGRRGLANARAHANPNASFLRGPKIPKNTELSKIAKAAKQPRPRPPAGGGLDIAKVPDKLKRFGGNLRPGKVTTPAMPGSKPLTPHMPPGQLKKMTAPGEFKRMSAPGQLKKVAGVQSARSFTPNFRDKAKAPGGPPPNGGSISGAALAGPASAAIRRMKLGKIR